MAVALLQPAAATDYPTRAVTFVVPYAAGGATDLLARTLAQNLEAKLGKPFVIENRVGRKLGSRRDVCEQIAG